VFELSELDSVSNEDVSKFILARLRRMLSTLADEQVYDGQTSTCLSEDRGFTTEVDFLLQQRIPVPPKAFGDFSNRLHDELIHFLRVNGRFSGEWGWLELHHGFIILKTLARTIDLSPVENMAEITFD
jgi:hypothetical protein